MTREERKEAIEYLKKYRELDERLYQTAPFTSVSHNALVKCLRHWDTAIQALEQEPCEDAISRDAVLEKAVYTETEEGWCGYSVDVDYIKSLPPVKPKEKIGYWIKERDELLDKIREEIEQASYEYYFEYGEYISEDTRKERIINTNKVLQIIDKYKAESEE